MNGIRSKVSSPLSDQKQYPIILWNSEAFTLVLIVVFGISNIYFTDWGLWNLIPGILAFVNLLVKIYILKLYFASKGTWKGSVRIWASLIFGDLALIILFLLKTELLSAP